VTALTLPCIRHEQIAAKIYKKDQQDIGKKSHTPIHPYQQPVPEDINPQIFRKNNDQ
jgi:hypothetical protein